VRRKRKAKKKEKKKVFTIELRELEDLSLADEDVLQGVDGVAGLFDLFSDGLGDELEDEVPQLDGGRLAGHDVNHLLADGADLGGLGVAGLLHLVGAPLGEANGEEADAVAVSGLDVDVGLDERLPLLDEGAELVAGEIHAVEVGQAVPALDLVGPQLDLPVGLLIVVEVGEGDLEDTSVEGVSGELGSGGAVHKGLARLTVLEEGGSLDIVPVLAGVGIDAARLISNFLMMTINISMKQQAHLSN